MPNLAQSYIEKCFPQKSPILQDIFSQDMCPRTSLLQDNYSQNVGTRNVYEPRLAQMHIAQGLQYIKKIAWYLCLTGSDRSIDRHQHPMVFYFLCLAVVISLDP